MIAVFLKKHSRALIALTLFCFFLGIYVSFYSLASAQKSQSQATVHEKQIPASQGVNVMAPQNSQATNAQAINVRAAQNSQATQSENIQFADAQAAQLKKETIKARSSAATSHPNSSNTYQSINRNGSYKTRSFVIYDEYSGRITRRLKANLKASGKHADIWVDPKETISDQAAKKMVKQFDERIYPTDIKNFANKKCSSNVRRAAFLITDIGNSDGYFDSRDIESMNKMNLIYLNAELVRTEPSETYSTLAHEFEHLLFYMSTRNGAAATGTEWLDEGLAVYAENLNGNFPSYFVDDFRRNPRVKLDGEFAGLNNSYGAAFLFISFAADQVKASDKPVPDFLKDLIYNSGKGMHGVNVILHRYIANKSLDSYPEIYKVGQLKTYANTIQR